MNNVDLILVAIYCIIGIMYTTYHWHKYYEKDYELAKENEGVEAGMANILMLFVWVLWPLFAFKEIFIKIKKLSV